MFKSEILTNEYKFLMLSFKETKIILLFCVWREQTIRTFSLNKVIINEIQNK